MDADTLRTLIEVDAEANAKNPRHRECPDDLDFEGETNKLHALRPTVEQLTGRTFEGPGFAQDASFFTDLATYDVTTNSRGGRTLWAALAIRFSNFGGLFTVWTTSATPVSPEIVGKVIEVVKQHGYRYIDNAVLDESYSGASPRWKGESWRIRFFDYV
jgi:hypothetical protein